MAAAAHLRNPKRSAWRVSSRASLRAWATGAAYASTAREWSTETSTGSTGEGQLIGAHRIDGEEADVGDPVPNGIDTVAGGIPEDQLEGRAQPSGELGGQVDADPCGVGEVTIGQDGIA